ncbi:MAG: ABC transporter ATP-binding protein [Spirochaetales bacterium]|nr:ABC transporter ATP-binding protein [Spirochaetales bacterium]
MIKTVNLTKKYGKFTAVDHLHLNIPAGEIYGFLGPNGAGKTTTIMMLLGITEPTEGEIFLFGKKYTSSKLTQRKRIGVVPEKHPRGMWKWMTAKEYLEFFGRLFKVMDMNRRISYLLEKVGLLAVQGKRIKGFSRGMLQKLSIARALIHDPDILFLDEPISGLDPIGIKKVRDLILSENREGRTIFISSHLLSEMEKICHRVAIIFNGSLVAEDNMENLFLKIKKEKEMIIELESLPEGVADQMKILDFIYDAKSLGNTLYLKVSRDSDFRKDISRFLIQKDLVPLKIEEKALSLEEAFTTITQENVAILAGLRGGK